MAVRRYFTKSMSVIRQKIMECLVECGERPAADIMEHCGISSGTLYTVLETLEGEGEIVSRWRQGPYPRRRLYRIPDRVEAYRG